MSALMVKPKISKKEYQDWISWCDLVQSSTVVHFNESEKEQKRRIKRLLKPENYGSFFEYYFPHYCDDEKTKCARYQVKNAIRLHGKKIITLIQAHHRGSAKSTHANMGYPLHLMFNGEMKFMVLMGYNEDKACTLLSDIQAELQNNKRLKNDFGEMFSHGDWADGSFKTKTGVAFQAISMLQDPSGLRNGPYRPDYFSVDDLDNRKKSRNKVLVKEAKENILEALKEASSKDRQRLVISNNRKIKNGILDTIINEIGKKPDVVVSVVNAVHDTIDYQPTWPERYTADYWRSKHIGTTYRTWEREYMNNPIEDGAIFKPEWIQWKKMLPLEEYDSLILYGDLSYTDTGDLKSMHLIGKKGRERHVIDAFNRQTSTSNAARWLYDRYEDGWRNYNIIYMIEANFMQGKFLNDFEEEGDVRGYYISIRGDKRSKGNKFDRIENMSPVFERLYVFFNEDKKKDTDFEKCIDCLLAFEKGSGAPDDPPDSLEGGFFELNRRPSGKKPRIRIVAHKNNFID